MDVPKKVESMDRPINKNLPRNNSQHKVDRWAQNDQQRCQKWICHWQPVVATQIFLGNVHPENWKFIRSNLTSAIFQMGWFNHSVFQKPVIGESPKVNQWIAVYRVYYIPYIFPNGGDLILVKVAQQLFVDSTNPGVSCLTESFPFYRILVCTKTTWTPMDSAPQLTHRFNFHTGTHGRVYKVADEICGGFNAVKVIRHRY